MVNFVKLYSVSSTQTGVVTKALNDVEQIPIVSLP